MFKVSRGAALDRIYLVKLFGFAVFLHRIHHSDPPRLYHSHPWNGWSFIFGSYVETQLFKSPARKRYFNRLRAAIHHRVEINRPTWTLFIHAPRCNRWSILDEEGHLIKEEPWRGEVGHKDYAKV